MQCAPAVRLGKRPCLLVARVLAAGQGTFLRVACQRRAFGTEAPSSGEAVSDAAARRPAALQRFPGLTKDEACDAVEALGLPRFTGRVLFDHVHTKGISGAAGVTALSKAARARLDVEADLDCASVARHEVSADGTHKWLLRMRDGAEVETVFIPEGDETTAEPEQQGQDGQGAADAGARRGRGTLCVSSQVGCSLSCSFCHTGTQPLRRNLTAAEIVAQLRIARRHLGDYPLPRPRGAPARRISNVVFMGQGEPFYNLRQVSRAVRLMTSAEGHPDAAVSRHRVTVSTSGVVPAVIKFARELDVPLAVSLHAADDATRTRIMAINRMYPLADLMAACHEAVRIRVEERGARARDTRITFEYVMLAGINDGDGDARALAALLADLPALVNLIPFNEWPGASYAPSSPRRVDSFARVLAAAGARVTVRRPRGADILAACGQLRSAALPAPEAPSEGQAER